MIKVRIVREANYLAKIPQDALIGAVLQYLKSHDLPEESFDGDDVQLFIEVPSGSDGAGRKLVLGEDVELSIKWSQRRTDDETVEVKTEE